MKLFETVNGDVTHDCCKYFAFILPSDLLVKRHDKSILRYNSSSLHVVLWHCCDLISRQKCTNSISAAAPPQTQPRKLTMLSKHLA